MHDREDDGDYSDEHDCAMHIHNMWLHDHLKMFIFFLKSLDFIY